MSTVKCVGILTSGGDAPGMNAAIRAVTRSAIYNGMRVKGIYRGYKGLILDEIEEFKTQNVSNIIQRGGTILKTATSSINHLGVDVAPQTPTRRTPSGKGSVISDTSEIKSVFGFAFRHSSNSIFPLELLRPATK